jgi:hypothetical protein
MHDFKEKGFKSFSRWHTEKTDKNPLTQLFSSDNTEFLVFKVLNPADAGIRSK